MVFQAEAAAILDEFERGGLRTLEDLVEHPPLSGLSVYHVGRSGPVRNRLKRLPDYQESVFDAGRPLGDVLRRRPLLRNEDHQRLTFESDRFDLMVSSHVLEHVPDWRAALAEAHRVLASGGRYIFSIPGRILPESGRQRATVVDGGVQHLAEPVHHSSPEGLPALVYTDFGQDLVPALEELGFIASLRRPHRMIRAAAVNFVVVAVKP